MSSTTSVKKKLCWNCDGHVSFDADSCPYCGSQLNKKEGKDNLSPPFQEEEFASSENQFKVPFDPEETPKLALYELNEGEKKNLTPWKFTEREWETLTGERGEPSVSDEDGEERRNILVTLAMLLIGSSFFLFSLALFFFSSEGSFTLTWKASSWYLYFVVSVPLLLYGWKHLKEVKS